MEDKLLQDFFFFFFTFSASSVTTWVVSADLLDDRLFFTFFCVSSFDSKWTFRAWTETTVLWRLLMDLLRAKLVLEWDWYWSSFPQPKASRRDSLVDRSVCGDISFSIASAWISTFSWIRFSVVIWYLLTKFISHVYEHTRTACRRLWSWIWLPGNQLGHRCGSVLQNQGGLVTSW